MTKRELIDEIMTINRSASPRFLARFEDVQLDEYLAHLRVLDTPRLSGSSERYEKYFRNCPTIPTTRPPWRTDAERTEEIAVEELDEADELEELTLPFVDPEMPEVDEMDDNAEPLDDPADLPVSPAEREGLFAEPLEEEAADDPSEGLPQEALPDKDAPEADTAAARGPARSTVRAAAGTKDGAEPVLAEPSSEDDRETWLY